VTIRVDAPSQQTPPDKTAPPESNASAARSSTYFAALRHRDFRLLWLGQIVSITGSQMQLIAINWHVYQLVRPSGERAAAFALGAVGLARVVPIILCSLVGGVVADALNRKRLLVATQSAMLVCAAALAAVTAYGFDRLWLIYALTALSSAAQAFDNPARQALMPSLVTPADFPNAASMTLVAFQVATVAGPVLGGFVLAEYGAAMVYAANAASFLAVIAAALLMKASGRGLTEEAVKVNFGALTEGLRFVWRTPVMVQTMALDFVATFFASATALLPIFAAEILRVSERGYGVLSAAAAVGAVLAGLAMARRPEWKRPGAIVIASVAVYGAATVGFGLSRSYWLSFLMLALTGAADTVSTVIRLTIRQLITPDRLRGRMTSVNMIFFMGGPQLGELEAGLVAGWLGAPFSVVAGGIGCLLAVVYAAFKAKELLRYRISSQADA
jgi:MFS family permease